MKPIPEPAPPPSAPPREGAVGRHFSAIAGRYDVMNTLLSLGLHHRWKRLAVAALDLQPGERVMDLCGGTADLALKAAGPLGPGGRVVLCDFNRAMLERGMIKVRRASLAGRITAVQGDAESLCFAPGSFAAVMVGFGVRNLTDRARGLAEMHRILKPGGRLMCLEFSLPVSGWFRRLYDLYSFRLMPPAGRFLAGNRDAYRYLIESIRLFPPPAELAALLTDIGFRQVAYRRLTDGIAVIHTGSKA
jgi:demethylmenaquinone methyltransferase / 2-methoxy-6-polyprenyl-1,4-benzoquinol methylase